MYFTIYQDKAGEWRWRLVAKNNEIIADSGESYQDRDGVLIGLNLVKAVARTAPIYDDTIQRFISEPPSPDG